MGNFKNKISKFNILMCSFLSKIICVCMFILFGIVLISVFSRYVLNNAFTWSEDATLIIMIWMTMLGAPIGLLQAKHVAIDMLLNRAPKKAATIIKIINILSIIFISAVYLYFGWKFSMKGMRRIVPSIEWLPFGFAYLSLPIGYGLMIPICIQQLLETLTPNNKRS